MYFKVKPTNVTPKCGSILISAPSSKDMYFKRSIVLIAENNDKGTIGFVLNRYIDLPITTLLGKNNIDFNAPTSLGGPVATNRIEYIHSLGDKIPESKHLFDNIYWGGDVDVILDFMKLGIIKENQIQFFIGYAGWTLGQLDNELKNDYWLVYKADAKSLLIKDTNYWKNTLKKMGKEYKAWLNLPDDPQLN